MLCDNDRAVLEDWIRTFCTGVTPVHVEPQDLAQSIGLYDRIDLVQRAVERAARDERISPEGKQALREMTALRHWLDAQREWLNAQGAGIEKRRPGE